LVDIRNENKLMIVQDFPIRMNTTFVCQSLYSICCSSIGSIVQRKSKQEQFGEDTKVAVIRSLKSMNRQFNNQKKRDKNTNNDPQNTTYKKQNIKQREPH
jgi:hypothetical protein